MKRIAAFALIAAMLFGMTGCDGYYRQTKLQYALEMSNLEAVREAIEAGEDTNYMRLVGIVPIERNPLKKTIQDRNTVLLRELLTLGADPNWADDSGVTPLMTAVDMVEAYWDKYWYTNGDFSALLLENGADVNQKDNRGFTALDYAIRSEGKDFVCPQPYSAVEILLEHGALVTEQTIELALKTPKEHGYQYRLVRRLVEKAKEQKVDMGLEPILEAAILSEDEKVQKLLGEGKADSKNRYRVILYTAAFCDAQTTKDVAMHYSYSIDQIQDEAGNTPMMLAAQCGNLDGFTGLLQDVDQIWSKDQNGYTLVEVAALANQRQIVQSMLQMSELAVYDQNVYEIFYSLLLTAVDYGDLEQLQYLLQMGYSVDGDWEPLLEGAIYSGNRQMIDYLLENVGSTEKYIFALSACCQVGDLETAEKLLERGAWKWSKFEEVPPFWHYAVEQNNIEMLKLLMEYEDLINNVAYEPEELLQTAIERGHLDIVRYLAEKVPDVEMDASMKNEMIAYAKKYPSERVIAYLESLSVSI